MSFSVVIVPEDPTNNGYILKPLIRRLLSACGKPTARVTVLTNPRTTGYEHAKSLLRDELIQRYRFIDLLLFLPDGDGKNREAEFSSLELLATHIGTRLLCCAAKEEVETWLLAGHVDRLPAPWTQVRLDTSVKEHYFVPFLQQFGDPRRPGMGREELMETTLANFQGLKTRCPELAQLESRLRVLLAS